MSDSLKREKSMKILPHNLHPFFSHSRTHAHTLCKDCLSRSVSAGGGRKRVTSVTGESSSEVSLMKSLEDRGTKHQIHPHTDIKQPTSTHFYKGTLQSTLTLCVCDGLHLQVGFFHYLDSIGISGLKMFESFMNYGIHRL